MAAALMAGAVAAVAAPVAVAAAVAAEAVAEIGPTSPVPFSSGFVLAIYAAVLRALDLAAGDFVRLVIRVDAFAVDL